MKDHYRWNEKKIMLDGKLSFSHPKEREMWWCSIGINVGTEIYGKGSNFTRPILIINAESNESFIGIPLSSRVKNGKYSCIIRTDDGKLHSALIFQIRNFDKRRLTENICRLSEKEYQKVKGRILELLK